jgi:hypothetical protein
MRSYCSAVSGQSPVAVARPFCSGLALPGAVGTSRPLIERSGRETGGGHGGDMAPVLIAASRKAACSLWEFLLLGAFFFPRTPWNVSCRPVRGKRRQPERFATCFCVLQFGQYCKILRGYL